MFKIIYDPTNHWTKNRVQLSYLIEKTRVPVIWAANTDWEPTLLGRIKSMYQFGWRTMDGFEISPEGIMSFPGDPDLYPLLYIQNGDVKKHGEIFTSDHLFFYNHDWISIMDPTTQQYVTARID